MMNCKWCTEGIDVQEGEKCSFCGTLYGEDKPEIKNVAVIKNIPDKLKIPLKEFVAKKTAKHK
jgi:hypothetical protein